MKNINFLPTEKDYKQFETDNKELNLNILKIKDNEEEIDYVCQSNELDRKHKINLLSLEDKHYVCVKGLDSLLNYSSSESESESKS